ncbi:hypothetical protein KP509_09G084900 [Ceratopteris richardii]|uniref:Small auxin up regulated protein n=1 Tax=Ceratopteris richardii TaxID=49495 RepID=A0A8T2U2Y4_CERRI|nr:hypothetical protein KP509_09G084900 [Ceratopteris richardii]
MSHGGLAPQGYLAIYVGRERRRFEIRAEHINHPVLRGLLQRTEEEFGLNQTGGLAIPACQVVLFEHLLWMLDNHDTAHLLQDPSELSELLDLYVPKRATLAGIACSTREKNLPTPTSAAHSG